MSGWWYWCRSTGLVATLASALLASSGAHAAISFEDLPIDFEDLPIEIAATSAARSSGGYTFETSTFQAIVNDPRFGAANGTHVLAFLGAAGGGTRLSADDGSLFALASIDVGGWLNFGPNPQDVTLRGQTQAGTTVEARLTVAAGPLLQPFSLTNFEHLAFVDIVGGTRGYLVIDNLAVSPSPIPEAPPAAMLLAGLGLLGAALRRR